jgi:hypothetical protein
MTDRELLREARQLCADDADIEAWVKWCRKADASLAEPQDAKPACWINLGDFEAMQDGQFNSCLVWRTAGEFHKAEMPLYAAHQPPAGKGEVKMPPPKWHDLLREIIRDWMTADGYLRPLWAGGLKDRIQGLLASREGDAIPREIHERLIAKKDAEIERLKAEWSHERLHYDQSLVNAAAEERFNLMKSRAETAERVLARAQEALRFIEAWQLPRATYQDFTKVNKGEATEPDIVPCSYGAAYGSNGERDYIRNIARTALAAEYERGG